MNYLRLTEKLITVVDDKDFEWAKEFCWYVVRKESGSNRIYPARKTYTTDGKIKWIYLHREIMKDLLTEKQPLVDHINGVTLDNRRINLRPCNSKQNAANTEKRRTKNPSSIYKGVHYYAKTNRWITQLRHLGKCHTVRCKTEDEAAMRYNELALKHLGEYARLNIIEGEKNG